MSKYTILSAKEIDKVHWDRASEILDTWAARHDADFPDLEAMIAEALQITENNTFGMLGNVKPTTKDEVEEDELGPDVEVITAEQNVFN